MAEPCCAQSWSFASGQEGRGVDGDGGRRGIGFVGAAG